MDQTLQTLLQYVSDPQDLADSISSFFQHRSEKLRPTMEKLSGVIDGSFTADEFIQDNTVLHKFSTGLGTDLSDLRIINLDEMVNAIESSLDELDADVKIHTTNAAGAYIEEITVEEGLSRFRELVASSDMLITALSVCQQYSDNTGTDFLLTSFARIEGYLQDTDLALRLKGIFTSVAEELQENIDDPVSLVESVLCHFGVGGRADDPRANDVSLYTGQSARCVLFTQAADKLGWAIANLPTAQQFVVGVCASIITGVQTLAQNAYKGLQIITEEAIVKLLELDDGIRNTLIPGRGTIQHPGFAMRFNDEYTSYPAGQDMADAFDAIRDAVENVQQTKQYTIPVGPMVIYINWLVDRVEMTYDIKPINYQIYREVFKEHFGNIPKLFIKDVGGVIQASNDGITLSDLTRADLLSFVTDLYSRNNIWGMDFNTDAKRYMCIQASRHLLTVIMALINSEVSVIDYADAVALNDAWLYMDVTKEAGYNQQSQSFIPENVNFASICTFLGTRSTTGKLDCFYSNLSANNVLDLTDPSGYTWQMAINASAFKMLALLSASIIGNDPESIGNFYVPYFSRFKRYRPSYYIPTDSENVEQLKRMIVTGLAVVGVIVVAVVMVIIAIKFKKTKWTLEQQAMQKAFTASELNDPALLEQGWQLQKRVNLLGILSGFTNIVTTPITSGVTTIYNSMTKDAGSSNFSSLEGLVRLIKG